ncbi:MAG: metal-dependent hydrolase [Nanoarchaeota archaeon]
MLFFTHLLAGAVLGLFMMKYVYVDLWLVFPFIIFGSLLADIDHPSSKLGKKLKFIGWIFGHRKIFHSIFLPFVIGLPLLFISEKVFYAFLLGFLSHLILDALTPKGVMPIYPLNNSLLGGPIKTGGIVEYLILMSLLLVMIFLLLF